MATMQPYELKPEGTWLTQSTDPVTGPCSVAARMVLPDAVVLSDDPITRVTRFVIEQTRDDGLTWTGMVGISWESGPQNAPLHPGNPVPMPGISTSVPSDGATRRFRARVDLPQPAMVGVTIEVVQA